MLMRAAPTLKYLQIDPQFPENIHDCGDHGDDRVDAGSSGGLTGPLHRPGSGYRFAYRCV
jgi:hypothetical protein